jgi:hypothetical protein
MKSSMRFTIALLVTFALTAVTYAAPALAAPPSNDTEAGALVIDTVPFTHVADTSEATPDGPGFCSNNSSVFYRFAPTEDARVQIDLVGSDYDTTLGVYRRDAEGAVVPLKCNDDRFGLDSGVRFRARPGMTYFVIVGVCCGNGRAGGGGRLELNVSEVLPLAIEMTVQIDGTGTVDTGMATISGTVTCNQRASFYASGSIRQLRGDDLFVARGSFWTEVGCMPEAPVAWSVEVDTETSIAFGAGSAALRMFSSASDGWDSVDLGRSDVAIQLVNG